MRNHRCAIRIGRSATTRKPLCYAGAADHHKLSPENQADTRRVDEFYRVCLGDGYKKYPRPEKIVLNDPSFKPTTSIQ